VHRLHGRVVHADGQPAADVLVAVADEDWAWDDLLGVGQTGPDGSFHLSFTPDAFRQEPLELESTPDIYVVLSIARDDQLVPVHRAAFPGLSFDGDSSDLGAVTLPPREAWEALEGLTAAPGWRKSTRRVDLSGALVAHCLAEIGPMVERLTGWVDIVQRTRVEVVPGPSLAWGAVLGAVSGTKLGALERTVLDTVMGIGGLAGLYDPYGRTVYLVESTLGAQNLDGVKVTLGHELVHAGQFLHHPELIERYSTYVASMVTANATDNTSPRADADPGGDVLDPRLGPAAAAAYQQSRSFMTNLEGYATYIEHDHLRPRYPMGTPLPHLSLWGRALVAVLRPEGKVGAGVMSDKQSEYAVGRRAYQRLRQGGAPARFDPALDPTAAPAS
jgi:hypothetical protein